MARLLGDQSQSSFSFDPGLIKVSLLDEGQSTNRVTQRPIAGGDARPHRGDNLLTATPQRIEVATVKRINDAGPKGDDKMLGIAQRLRQGLEPFGRGYCPVAAAVVAVVQRQTIAAEQTHLGGRVRW